MPVNSLSITKRELRKFEGTAESDRVDITGEYEVTIKNEGLLPTLASQYEVQELSPTSVNKTLITEKNRDIGRLSPGSSKSVNISFKINGSKDQLISLARTGCNGNKIECKVKEQVSGALLLLPFDKKRDLSVSAGSCSLDSGTGRTPVEPAPAPPEPAPRPPEPTPSEPVQDLTMRFDEAVSPTEVTAGEENSWVINGDNINEVNQIRVELGDGSTTTTRREMQAQNPPQPPGTSDDNNTPSNVGQVFRHTYASEGQYTIVAEAINSNGETVGSARYDITVNPQVTTDPVEPDPAGLDLEINQTSSPVNIDENLNIQYILTNRGAQSTNANINVTVSSVNGVQSETVETVNPDQTIQGELTVPSTAYGTVGEKTATLRVQGDSAQSNFIVQQQNGGQQFNSVDQITNQLNGIDAATEIIRLHGRVIRRYDDNNNGEINIGESGNAGQAFATGQITQDELDAIAYMSENNQYFPQNGEAEQRYLNNAELIHRYDENGNGVIDIGENGAAGQDFGQGQLSIDELEVIQYMFDNNIRFPRSLQQQQNTQSNQFLPPSMSQAADDGF